MGPLQELAHDIGADERTLRRAVSQGTLRARRTGPRRLRLASGEREYLCTHWQLLSALRKALRTQTGVRLAVLYGSLARGDEDASSDVDLLVSFADGRASTARLVAALRSVADRRIDIAHLRRVEEGSPLLMERILEEGRVLVDRDGLWPTLWERRAAVRARAQRAYRRQMVSVSEALAELTR
jgi:predicted nucleotidyltransferase